MKLQHLTIIFVIIIVPITLVISAYMGIHIDTIQKQTQYTTHLINATYDAMRAFQLNTANNSYSTISNSKIRDIEASVNTYFTSMGTGMSGNGYTANDLRDYTPALLFNLYDGYYIYTKYYDTVLTDYTYGLKPFITYSCRYISGSSTDCVINYTLDNTMTIIGKVNGNFKTLTGHLINLDSSTEINQKEHLRENLIILKDDGTPESINAANIPIPVSYEYLVYNGQKVYRENDIQESTANNKRYFHYSSEYKKDYINTSEDIIKLNNQFLEGSDSAIKYYSEARTFTQWVKANLGTLTVDNVVTADGTKIKDLPSDQYNSYFATNLKGKKIFDTSNSNDPLRTDSIFNEHRMNVIRKSIETNLKTAIANYNTHTENGYEFRLPVLSEDEWYKIENNICMISFLQGLPIKSKVFNNYCVVANNTNQETIGSNSIYIVTQNTNGQVEYHRPGCKSLIDGINSRFLYYNRSLPK